MNLYMQDTASHCDHEGKISLDGILMDLSPSWIYFHDSKEVWFIR